MIVWTPIARVIYFSLLTVSSTFAQEQAEINTHLDTTTRVDTPTASDTITDPRSAKASPVANALDSMNTADGENMSDSVPSTGVVSVVENIGDGTLEGQSRFFEVVKDYRRPSALHSAMLSVVLPGAGFIYNQSNLWYFKTLGVWTFMSWTIFQAARFGIIYNLYRDAFIRRGEGLPIEDPVISTFTDEQIISGEDNFEYRRDLWIAISTLAHVINVLWAYTDAHLNRFEVFDDINVSMRPMIPSFTPIHSLPSSPSNVGIGLSLAYKIGSPSH